MVPAASNTGNTRQRKSDWDVMVAGSGPAGAVAALVLARSGARVLLADPDLAPRAPWPPQHKIGETLPGAATPLLRDLGLLPILCTSHHLPCYGTLSAWGADELTVVDFVRDPNGHGWRLDRTRFEADLRSAAVGAGATPRTESIVSARRGGAFWKVGFSGGGEARTRWLVDATGRRAAIARRIGHSSRVRDTGLVAVCHWRRTRAGDADTRTLVEADADGWWYTALLPDGYRVVAYHVDPKAAAVLLRVPGAFDQRLSRTSHVCTLLDATRDDKSFHPLRAVDASGGRLEQFRGDGWLAVGDAALSFDPLSSQGIFTAIYSGMKAGQAVALALVNEDGSTTRAAIADYAYRLESIRAAYQRHYTDAYATETRWQEHVFWSRRQ